MRSLMLQLAAAAAVALFITAPTWADTPGKHPAYLHALSDLRDARAHLERLSSEPVDQEEDHAIAHIDKAIGEIKHAAIDDGKDLHDHPVGDFPNERPGRLHTALDLLRKVHSDVAREEDDPMTKGLRNRAVRHIDAAIHATEASIADVSH